VRRSGVGFGQERRTRGDRRSARAAGGARPASPSSTPRGRLVLLVLGTAAGLLCLVARCAWLQIVKGPDLLDTARAQQERTITLDPPRGPILDRNGKELAVSLDVDSVFAEPAAVADAAAAARRLGPALDLPAAILRQRLESGRSFVWLKRKITPDLRRRIEALDMRGVGFARESRRFYPKRTLAAHVLGSTGIDDQGLGGLEFAYDSVIRGTPGQILALRDGRGGRVLDRSRKDPRPGSGLVLTLDEVVQHLVERELDAVMRETGAAGAGAVVLDPRTGEVLALASRPTFDPNNYAAAGEAARRNRVVTDYYEPGSTFKIVTAAAALDAGRIHPNEIVWCENGSIVVAGHRFREDRRPFGNLTLTEVLAKSSNVGAIKVAKRLAPGEFFEAVRAFGFGGRTGIELPGESPGLLREVRDWSGLSQASLSLGQEIGVTAVQLAATIGAIANDGVWLRPRLVRGTIDADGTRRPAEEPAAAVSGRRAVSPDTARRLRRMLQAVTGDEGTGRAAALQGYSVGGKTGTAQKADASGRYARGRHVSWFAGFVPAGEPALAIVVMVDEPRGAKFHGGDVAAPVFQRIALPALKYLGVPPDREGTLVFDRTLAAWSRPADAGSVRPAALPAVRRAAIGSAVSPARLPAAIRPSAAAPFAPAAGARSGGGSGGGTRDDEPGVAMPDLAGMSLRRATETLAAFGLTCRHETRGPRVVRQEPEAGAPIDTATPCRVIY
jgi:cell division protein FtsI/penicillin-binding protein 2